VFLVGQSLRRCANGGRTCDIFKGAPGGDDYHQIWLDPSRNGHMATASDQGVVVSVDGGKSWSSWYNQPTGQFYHLADDRRFPWRLYSGQQDSGTVGIATRSDYGSITERDWRPVGGEERDYDIPDPENPDIVYGSGLGGRITRWDAATGQVANIAPYPTSTYGKRPTTVEHRFVWVTPMAVSKTGPVTVYVGAERVFASTDRGTHWTAISGDLTGRREGAARCDGDVAVADAKACGYGGIWSLAPSPRNAGELWVGTDDGLVQLTRDGGAHWAQATPPAVPEWAKIASVDVSALADGTAYVAVDNQRQGDLEPRAFATRDYGATWRDIAIGLPRGHFVSVVRADPQRAGLLYAGTDTGVLVSFDDGASWGPLQGNLPTAWVRDLLVHGDELAVATQGRALWILGDLALVRQLERTPTKDAARLFTPAVAVRVRADANRDTPKPADEPAGENPPTGAVIDYWLATPAQGEVAIEIRDPSGRLVLRLSSVPAPRPQPERYFSSDWVKPAAALGTTAGLHRAVWDLRWPRPRAISYDYSIATAPGADTPIVPEGPLALPGDYTVVLRADGREWRAPLKVVNDPRSVASADDLQASLAASQVVAGALETAWRGEAQMEAVHKQLTGLRGRPAAKPALVADAKDLAGKSDPSAGKPTFASLSAILAAQETDLEATDRPPTAPQQAMIADSAAKVDALWRAWVAERDGPLASLNRRFKAGGVTPVEIPPDDSLTVAPADDGDDLP
ncbi:MAG: hypothetical protein JOZ27_02765, partial [Caulobacteraceae bacterium]|nr:hypothetical protein [Caulobacteraceae bacterium]